MAVAALLTLLLGLPGIWFAGRYLGRSQRRAAAAGLVCVAGLAFWLYASEWSSLALRLVPWDDYLFFERLPLYLGILLLLAICLR